MKKTSFLSGLLIGVVICLGFMLLAGHLYFENINAENPPAQSMPRTAESPDDYLAALNSRRPQDMLGALDKIIQLRPRDPVAYLTKADLLAELGDFKNALKAYEAALSLDPSNPRAYLGRAVSRAMLGDFSGAAADLNIAISLDPKLASAYYNRGVANVNLSRILEAESDFQKASDLFLQAKDMLNHRDAANALKLVKDYKLAAAPQRRGARGHAAAGTRQKALQNPKDLVSVKRDSAAARENRTSLMSSLRGAGGVLDKFRASAETNRQGDMPGLGDLGNYEAAVRKTMAENAGKQSNQPKSVLDHLAESRRKIAAGDSKGAIEALDQAIALRPNDASLYAQRAGIHAQNKDRASALADYNKALEIDPNNAGALYGRGQQKSMMGDNKGAVED
jgi:tetratricopeptide (TPR) repeat protein